MSKDRLDPKANEFINLNRIPHINTQTGRETGTKEDVLLRQSAQTIACAKHRHGDPRKRRNYVAFACAHCTHQDEVRPVGMAALKGRVYLCMDCYRRLDNKRGFNEGKELRTTCWGCIMEEAGRIKRINPYLLLDLTK